MNNIDIEAAMGYDAATIPEIVSDLRNVAEAEEDVLCLAAADLIETLLDRLVAANGALEICSKSWEECNTQLIAAKAQAQTARDDALREAAKLAWDMDSKYLRKQYLVEHNRKRYDVAGVERCENKTANVIAEDIHNAILAMIQPTPTTDRTDAATEE